MTVDEKKSLSDNALDGFDFVPLSIWKATKSSMYSIPASNLCKMQELVESNAASFCVTSAVLARVAMATGNASPSSKPKLLTASKDEKTVYCLTLLHKSFSPPDAPEPISDTTCAVRIDRLLLQPRCCPHNHTDNRLDTSFADTGLWVAAMLACPACK